MSVTQAEKAAERLLKKHGIKRAPVPVEQLVKREDLKLKYHDLEDTVSGLLIDQRPEVVVAVNSKHHPNRQRFTIAHELGHYTLHRGDPTVFVDNLLVHFRSGPATLDHREAEANAFAAALLMPQSFLIEDIEKTNIDALDESAVKSLAAKYQVSVMALTIRLERLSLISR